VHDYLHQWVIRNLVLAASIGLCGFALLSDQTSAGPSSPSMSSDSGVCEKEEDCFQAAAMPKERFGKALNKEQVLLLKLDRLQRVMERFPATIWAKRAGVLSGVLLLERNPAVAIQFLRAAQRDLPVLDDYIRLWTGEALMNLGNAKQAADMFESIPQAVPDSAGIPKSVRDDMIIAPFNDAEAVDALVREHKDDLAGVIVEPFQRIIPPEPGFLAAVRKTTADNGVPLIFDEVVTGFRLAYGGAQEYYGVVPDLCTLGKVIGGGFPLAAIAGKAEIMAHFDKSKVGDENYLVQIGTLSGNPVAAAAGLATMAILKRPGAYERIHATGKELMAALDGLLRQAGIPAQISGEPPLWDVVFTDQKVRDYRGTLAGDPELMRRFNLLLRERGILKGESKYYISLAHTDDDIAFTIDAWKDAIKELKA